jgi:hypothetical protein
LKARQVACFEWKSAHNAKSHFLKPVAICAGWLHGDEIQISYQLLNARTAKQLKEDWQRESQRQPQSASFIDVKKTSARPIVAHSLKAISRAIRGTRNGIPKDHSGQACGNIFSSAIIRLDTGKVLFQESPPLIIGPALQLLQSCMEKIPRRSSRSPTLGMSLCCIYVASLFLTPQEEIQIKPTELIFSVHPITN